MNTMTLEEAKEYTREKLEPYFSSEEIEEVVERYIAVLRPGVVLINDEIAGLMELYL